MKKLSIRIAVLAIAAITTATSCTKTGVEPVKASSNAHPIKLASGGSDTTGFSGPETPPKLPPH